MKTGVIGLGAMGAGMAANLHKAGHLHRIWNRTAAKAEALAGETGVAGNWFLDHRGRTMLAGEFDVGFKVNLHHKDLRICLEMAAQNPGAELPLTEVTVAHYERLMAEGHGDEDISSLYRLKRHAG